MARTPRRNWQGAGPLGEIRRVDPSGKPTVDSAAKPLGEIGRIFRYLQTGQKVRIPAWETRTMMTAQDVKQARKQLGLTQSTLAQTLRMGQNGERQVRRWEDGEVPISGPASVALEALLTGWRPQ